MFAPQARATLKKNTYSKASAMLNKPVVVEPEVTGSTPAGSWAFSRGHWQKIEYSSGSCALPSKNSRLLSTAIKRSLEKNT